MVESTWKVKIYICQVLIVFNYGVQVEEKNKESATVIKLEALSIHGNILDYNSKKKKKKKILDFRIVWVILLSRGLFVS